MTQHLTPAERKALAALHRWLHSPIGDDMLIDESQDYHEQVEAESAAECARLQAEEREAYSGLQRDEATLRAQECDHLSGVDSEGRCTHCGVKA